MRTLLYSLLLFVFLASAGLGWLFDYLYAQNHSLIRDVDKAKMIEDFGYQWSNSLANFPSRAQYIEHWQTAINENLSVQSEAEHLPFELSLLLRTDLPMPNPLALQMEQGEPLLLETKKHLTWYFPLKQSQEVLLIKAPKSYFLPAISTREYGFTIGFYIALLLLFLLWVFPLIQQLLSLRHAAKRFGQGDLQQRIPPRKFSYLKEIEAEFNQMAYRIESLVDDVKLLSSAVSHDLRTPLARIRFGIDTLAEESDPMLRQKYQEKISDHIDDMTTLVETLLTYARLDQIMVSLHSNTVDLVLLITQCIKANNPFEENISFAYEPRNLTIQADAFYIKMIINNLLQNALTYGGGQVLIECMNEDNYCKIYVHDNGKGIDVSLREKIVKPFVRGDQYKTKTGGHGIGLALVKRVLDWHQGKLVIENSTKLGGACFIVALLRN
ncbi:sensor histidine kinase [Microbulbifer spongiae]|uniref:histidine kinase n=1 Tax=Microbulbifer spongiae TaxID=2944933 RepID=A0ABY9E6A1_9GAMM|nr:ATP-binding protein [Microbulbifer sp. MI-G]WKD48564.1 ATP-binding protein [Microbulbifer sp. MI-G]